MRAALGSVRIVTALLTAVSANDADAIERACDAADDAGVSAGAIASARQRLRHLREASLLAAAVAGSHAEVIDQEITRAARAGVASSMLHAARQRARQLREARLLIVVARSSNAAEIERECEEAAAGGWLGEATLEAARQRAQRFRQEQRFAALLLESEQQLADIEAAPAEDRPRGVDSSARLVEDDRPRGADSSAREEERAMWTDLRRQHSTSTALLMAAVRVLDGTVEGVGAAASARQMHLAAERAMQAAKVRARELGEAALAQPCTICLESLAATPQSETDSASCEEEEVCSLPCRHTFHGRCLLGWLRAHGTCPNCRWTAASEDEALAEHEAADTETSAEFASGLEHEQRQ